MPKFNIERELPACVVDKPLIQELERYLRGHAATLLDPPQKLFAFSITIEDGFGTETLDSAEEVRSNFRDDTKAVRMGIHYTSASCTINFLNKLLPSYIDISAEGARAREVAIGLYEGLLRIIEARKSGARFFHPRGGFILRIGLAAGVFYVMMLIILIANRSLALFLGVIAIATVFYLIGGLFNPLTAFSGHRNEARLRWWRWLVMGGTGFMLFTVVLGTIFVIIRKNLVGL